MPIYQNHGFRKEEVVVWFLLEKFIINQNTNSRAERGGLLDEMISGKQNWDEKLILARSRSSWGQFVVSPPSSQLEGNINILGVNNNEMKCYNYLHLFSLS